MRDNIKGGALTETTLLILLSVYNKPKHGYGIMQFIEEQTGGRVSLGAGTLYGAINTLIAKQLITPYAEYGAKKEYIINEEGRKTVKMEANRLNAINHLVTTIMEENEGA